MSRPEALNDADVSLLDRARSIIALRKRQDWHHIGCAMRTRSGAVFTAVHLEAYVGRVAVCAEAIAVGMGELISDYAPEAEVIVPGAEGPERVSIRTLLPNKYTRAKN
ncbi:MAG: cytidine deaminase [Chloroflexi bacterium]|nr:cytidine deaminase [Chloroflexota bacterium]